MKFLIDVCAMSRSLHAALTDLGHDVLSAHDLFPHASDETLLAFAHEENRILITEDKDLLCKFGDRINSVPSKLSYMLSGCAEP